MISVASATVNCTLDVFGWFLEMLLNPTKTEAAIFRTRDNGYARSTVLPVLTSFADSVKVLGVTLDSISRTLDRFWATVCLYK